MITRFYKSIKIMKNKPYHLTMRNIINFCNQAKIKVIITNQEEKFFYKFNVILITL
jgi:hypothetical protein